ncbi:hypothetical protein [Ferrovum sp.]|jgi:3'-5' exoribonuclease|uniref:hypothetical protein n=1 Tax=Ferrovum sp. TaxID=2609467 RepID=UPI0026392CE6|nr:hypothetical protein [Ferrovum sp.]
MNNLARVVTPFPTQRFSEELPTPVNMEGMPCIFRITSINCRQRDTKCIEYTATIYHERAAMKVQWTRNQPDPRLKPFMLVSPRWFAKTLSENGAIKICRLVLLERPESQENLFQTVPHGWVKNRELIKQAASLVDVLPRAYRFLFNAIFWNGERFRRYCTGPSSKHGHHNYDNGNLIHSVDVALRMQMECMGKAQTDTALGIIAGLLHDAGKADEYRLSSTGEWILTDRGTLLGHKVTIIEWMAQALVTCRILMPEAHYQGLLHCLTSAQNAPEWLGIRTPMMQEALLLSGHDRFSGNEDLIQRNAPLKEGWGSYHKHLRGRPYQLGGISTDTELP